MDSATEIINLQEKSRILKIDVQELVRLMEFTNNVNVKDILQKNVADIDKEIDACRQALRLLSDDSNNLAVLSEKKKVYNVKLTTYAWDQSGLTISLFVTLPGVQDAPKENITCNFGTRSIDLIAKEIEGKNYTFTINNFAEKIVPENSFYKIKKDMIVLQLKKEIRGKWDCLTLLEKQAKERKTPKFDDNDCSGADGLMKVMQRIYEDGDDDMKRTIAKAWTESREKQQQEL